MFGESYAKITKKAILQEEPKGADLDTDERYKTLYRVEHNEAQHRRYRTSSVTLQTRIRPC